MTMRDFVKRGTVGTDQERFDFESCMLKAASFQTNELREMSLVTADAKPEFWVMAFECWKS